MEEAIAVGVGGCLVPAFSAAGWDRQEQLATDPRVRQALGLHPWALAGLDPDSVMELVDSAFGERPSRWGAGLVAVGECGLDRARTELKALFPLQIEVFDLHLRWAQKLQLPIIVHSVQAIGATLEALKARPCPRGGVMHSYGGPPEMIARFAELGMYFSYSGNLNLSKKARESLLATPRDRLLWETDGPYGKGLDGGTLAVGPQCLPQVVVFASQILGKSIEWCWSVHNENMASLFHIQETT